jgi:hypothetical protein
MILYGATKTKTAFGRFLFFLCGMRESDPHFEFGKLACCHYTNPASQKSIH